MIVKEHMKNPIILKTEETKLFWRKRPEKNPQRQDGLALKIYN